MKLADVIQGYGERPLANLIICLAGFARAGKDTAGQFLVERYGVQRYAFADKLKEAARRLSVVDRLEIDGDTQYVERPYWDGREETKRHPCVQLGKVMRDVVDPLVWVNALFRDRQFLAAAQETGVVLTDVRYLNEWEAALAVGCPAALFWLERAVEPQGEEAEKTLPLKSYARVVENFGTVEELHVELALSLHGLRGLGLKYLTQE